MVLEEFTKVRHHATLGSNQPEVFTSGQCLRRLFGGKSSNAVIFVGIRKSNKRSLITKR